MPKAEPYNRRDDIFDMVVRSYIETAEPVGSRTISKRHKIGLSPASIRNVMADLEDQGFLKHPHTSAGRIPTDKGYRYWVDSLMEPEDLTDDEKDWVSEELGKSRSIEGLADRVSKVMSVLTENAAVLYIKNLRRVSFLNYLLQELVEARKLDDFFEEEAELFVEGMFRVLDQPEFQDLQKMRTLMQAFEEKVHFVAILLKDLDVQGVQVHIGHENTANALENVSLVVKDCYLAGVPIGSVAVIGPTRMKYSKVMPVVEFVADSVTEVVKRF